MASRQLDQLGDSLTGIVTSLRGLCEDARKEDAALVATVASIVDRLNSIRSSVVDIRRILVESHAKGERSEDDDDDGSSESDGLSEASCVPKFRTGLDVCVSGCHTVMGRLDAAVASSESQDGGSDDETDWESSTVAGSSRGSRLVGDSEMDDLMRKVEAVVGPLSGALEVLLWVLKASKLGLADQQALLECRTSREVFRRLEKALQNLKLKDRGGRGQFWSRLTGKLGSNRSQLKPPKPPLHKSQTWPIITKNPVDVRNEEARKISARIDREIEADSFAERNRSSILLMSGSYGTKMLLTENFAAFGKKSAEESDIDLEGAIDPIRKHIVPQVRGMVDDALLAEDLGTEETALAERILAMVSLSSSVLDQELAESMEKLWSSPTFREACLKAGRPEAYDRIIMDAVRRASLTGYVPTPLDHRRFSRDMRYLSHCGTFSFNFDPVSLSILNPSVMNRSEKTRPILKQFAEEVTSLLFFVDLAQHDEPLGFGTEFTFFLRTVGETVRSSGFRASRPSVIFILTNVTKFREKLRLRPLSKVYPDYMGPHDLKHGVDYMIHQLISVCGNDRTQVYPHVGEASDVSTVRFILAVVKETMLQRALRESGLF